MIQYPILAIDYGDKHFGISISDSKGIIASPLETVSLSKNRDINIVITEILELAKEYRAKTLLIGVPQSFSQTYEKTEKKINNFIKKITSVTEIPVITYDESFSTISAQNMLTSSGQSTKHSRIKIDKIAATVFLQEFLNSKQKE